MGRKRGSITSGLLAAALLCGGTPSLEAAQVWPQRPIRVVVPFAAGGGTDPLIRLIANDLTKRLGQQVIVDFRRGANGTIGATIVAKAAPDGYTLLFASPAPIVNARFKAGLQYDPATDLVPIVQATDAPFIVASSAKFAPRTFKELVSYALANPGKVKTGVSGLGGQGHLAAAIVEHATGMKFLLVPYNGVGERLTDMMSGRVDVGPGFAAGYLPYIRAGTMRALLVMSDKRLPELPDTPHAVEVGFPGARLSAWFILFGPKGLPKEIVTHLNEHVNAFLRTEEAKAKIAELGNIPTGGTPEQARKAIEEDVASMAKLVKSGAFKVNYEH